MSETVFIDAEKAALQKTTDIYIILSRSGVDYWQPHYQTFSTAQEAVRHVSASRKEAADSFECYRVVKVSGLPIDGLEGEA